MNSAWHLLEMGPAIVGIVFLWAAVAKLTSVDEFKITLWNIPRLPEGMIQVIVWALPALEIFVALGLILCLDIAKWAAFGVLLSFCMLTVFVLKTKLRIPCNCFGSGNRVFSKWMIVQNIGLIALVFAGFPFKSAEEPWLNVLYAGVCVVGVLSVATVWTNRKIIRELRHLNAI